MRKTNRILLASIFCIALPTCLCIFCSTAAETVKLREGQSHVDANNKLSLVQP